MTPHTLEKPFAYLCPRIVGAEQRHVYYGGDQAWFPRNTAYKGGCGPICAANILTVYADKNPQYQANLGITIDEKHFIAQDEYLHMMKDIYKAMYPIEVPLTSNIYDKCSRSNKVFRYLPATFGVTMAHFARGVMRYAASKNIYLQYRSRTTIFCSYTRGLTFIKLALANGYPVVLLTTNNKFPFVTHERPYMTTGTTHKMARHFVTITDIKETDDAQGPTLTITTWGKTGTIAYKDLYRSWNSIRSFGSTMLYFTPAKSKRVTKLSMYKTFTILLKR